MKNRNRKSKWNGQGINPHHLVRLEAFNIAKELITRALLPFNPAQIYLFGSIAKKETPHNWIPGKSDVDIAIKGVSVDRIEELKIAIREALGHDRFDIALIENCTQDQEMNIRFNGQMIYMLYARCNKCGWIHFVEGTGKIWRCFRCGTAGKENFREPTEQEQEAIYGSTIQPVDYRD